MIGRILPSGIAAAETFEDDADAELYPQERAFIARAAESRRREFATARGCARTALARLGRPPVAVLPGPGGAPQWPEGVTGSITHCAGYRAAAVGLTTDVASLGVDAEPNEALPDHGMLELIALGEERVRLDELAASVPGICWDRLLFCAKESIYKAWFPLARCWLGFDQAEVSIDPDRSAFTARVLVPGPVVEGSELPGFRGRWLARDGLLLTAITVHASGPVEQVTACRQHASLEPAGRAEVAHHHAYVPSAGAH